MKAVRLNVQGRLITGRRGAIVLLPAQEAQPEEQNRLTLRFAFVTQGRELHVFPGLLLDDWGNEISSLAIYGWVRDNGALFPRAELFGFRADGKEVQYFLRELEVYGRLPCYAFPDKNSALTEGVQIEAMLVPDDGVEALEKIKRPSHLGRPLSMASVSWWAVNPGLLEQEETILRQLWPD